MGGSDYRTILVVEKSDYTVTITLIVNISVVVFILFILLIICPKKRITNVEQMEEEKMRNSNYMRHPEIIKNLDKSILDKLLTKKENVIMNDNLNIDLAFKLEDNDPEYKMNPPLKTYKPNLENILGSPNDSLASTRTDLSILPDG